LANLSLVFDILARDNASGAFRDVGNAAERAGHQGQDFGSRIAGGVKLAAAGLLGAGLLQGFKSLYDAAVESAKVAARTNNVCRPPAASQASPPSRSATWRRRSATRPASMTRRSSPARTCC
jgi:hypothetical protein